MNIAGSTLARPMLVTMADGRGRISPLGLAALAVVGEGVNGAALRQRMEAEGALLDDGTETALLDELSELGLIRVARNEGNGSTYVTTSLGAQIAQRIGVGEAAAQLEELERLRTDLLSTIAHEMRTPLTAVRTSVGLLQDGSAQPSSEQRQQLLDVIERNAERMQRLIADILDLSRFRSGAIRLQSRRFDARQMAQEVIAGIQPIAEQRHQVLELEPASRPVAVFGDHRRLEQALVNLVSNAQRFAPDGGRVTVSVESDRATVRWRVRDDGPGIPAEDRARLFERFFVGRSDRNAPRDGVGLGLPTALAIAQAHGGTIEVDSQPGQGSTFTLAVPVAGAGEE